MTDTTPVLAADSATPLVMGVLNVTPDSFSDGGEFIDADAAIEHGLELVRQGADLVDVGGETTKPGAARVPVEEEQRRILPVVRALVAEGVTVSVDTMNAATAKVTAELGAAIINDVSGGLADPLMARTVADLDTDFVVMHWRGPSSGMDGLAVYDDVVAEVREELVRRITSLTAAGIAPGRLIVDPGLGFAKRAEHSWEVLTRLRELSDLADRILVGTSRKRFLSTLQAAAAAESATVLARGRDRATAITSTLAAEAGAWAVRVHDVPSTVRMLRTWAELGSGASQGHGGTPSDRAGEHATSGGRP